MSLRVDIAAAHMALSVRDMSEPNREDDATLAPTLAPVDSSALGQLGHGAPLIAGRYQPLAFLGQGGMGSVYRVRDLELEETVALKFLSAARLEHPTHLQRFRQEVRLARRVTHRNVARTYDIGEYPGGRFLTMEYVEGEPLARQLAREGKLPVRPALELAIQICQGLAAAHGAGVIHRDMKPDNVIVEASGRAVITDFGIARADNAQVTSSGAIGTPAYMAPEQVEALPELDFRADQYAFGAMLFEMVVGRQPWTGGSVFAVAAARLVAPPPDPRAYAPGLPSELALLILCCMRRDPTERFGSTSELALSLTRILEGLEPETVGVPSRSARPGLAIPGNSAEEKTIAVLPFTNLGDAGDQLLSEELTDDLIDVLCMTRSLRVRPRALLARVADQTDPLEMGRALGAQVIVQGSMRRVGGVLRVSVRLISVAEGLQLWAERFETKDPLALNDAVARSVSGALMLERITQTRHAPGDSEVLDLYVRARRALRRGWSGAEDPTHAIELFGLGLERAPNDPGLLAGHAMAHVRAFNYAGDGAEPALAKARVATERAIELAPRSAEAWLARATLLHGTSNWADAVTALRKTLELSPGSADAQAKLAIIELETGLVEAAVLRLQGLLALDPAAAALGLELARAHALFGRWEEASAALVSAEQYAAEPALVEVVRRRIAIWGGEAADSRVARTLTPHSSTLDACIRGFGQALAERRVDPVLLQSIESAASGAHQHSRYRPALFQIVTELNAFTGRLSEARDALHRCVDSWLYDLVWLDRCPVLAPLRSEPSFPPLRAAVAARAKEVLVALEARSTATPRNLCQS